MDYADSASSPRRVAASRVLGNTLVVLDSLGALHTVCAATMMPLHVWSEVNSKGLLPGYETWLQLHIPYVTGVR